MGPTRGPDAVWSYTRVMRFVAPAFEVLRTPVGSVMAYVLDLLTPVADPGFRLYTTLLGFADKPHISRIERACLGMTEFQRAHPDAQPDNPENTRN